MVACLAAAMSAVLKSDCSPGLWWIPKVILGVFSRALMRTGLASAIFIGVLSFSSIQAEACTAARMKTTEDGSSSR